jgi:hypothetical protein
MDVYDRLSSVRAPSSDLANDRFGVKGRPCPLRLYVRFILMN